jgi:O-acetyl-ADP-ribose deacetylase (regulator of RNase III)
MSVRITLKEGDLASEPADALVVAGPRAAESALPARFVIHALATEPDGAASETSVRNALRAALAAAREHGAKSVALPPLGAGAGLSLRRCAEILIEEARAHGEQPTTLEEIRFVVSGEPAYRMFEMVNDAARVADQLAKLRERRRPAR